MWHNGFFLHPTVNYDRRTFVPMSLQRGFTPAMVAAECNHWSVHKVIIKAVGDEVWVKPWCCFKYRVSWRLTVTFDSVITVNVYVSMDRLSVVKEFG